MRPLRSTYYCYLLLLTLCRAVLSAEQQAANHAAHRLWRLPLQARTGLLYPAPLHCPAGWSKHMELL